MSDATRAFYGRWARLYDVLANLPVVGSWRAAAADELALDPRDLAVEMGCGTGANLPFLRDRVGPDGRIVGIDVTREMLDRARGRGDADLLQADATRPPISEPIDGLLGTFVVAMFTDPGSVLDGWCDLVRPGGRVALLHFTRSERAWASPVNAGYRAFVWLSSTDKSRVRDVTAGHDQRVDAGLEALAARSTDYRERTLAGGYLRLASGRIE